MNPAYLGLDMSIFSTFINAKVHPYVLFIFAKIETEDIDNLADALLLPGYITLLSRTTRLPAYNTCGKYTDSATLFNRARARNSGSYL